MGFREGAETTNHGTSLMPGFDVSRLSEEQPPTGRAAALLHAWLGMRLGRASAKSHGGRLGALAKP